MNKSELKTKTDKVINETHDALQLIWDNTNKGQRNKLLKNEKVKAILDRYGIVYE